MLLVLFQNQLDGQSWMLIKNVQVPRLLQGTIRLHGNVIMLVVIVVHQDPMTKDLIVAMDLLVVRMKDQQLVVRLVDGPGLL